MDDPLVRLVSLMDHTPGQRQFVRIDKLKIYYQGKHGLTDDQFEDMIVERKALQEKYSDHCRTLAEHAASEAWSPPATMTPSKRISTKRMIGSARVPDDDRGGVCGPGQGHDDDHGRAERRPRRRPSGNVSAGELAEGPSGCALLRLRPGEPDPRRVHASRRPQSDAARSHRHGDAELARMVGLDDRDQTGKRADLARVRRLDDGTPVVRNVWREAAGRRNQADLKTARHLPNRGDVELARTASRRPHARRPLPVWHGTTILQWKGNRVVVAGDGQVTLTVIKSQARKVRKLVDGSVMAGPRRTPSRCSSGFRRSWKSIRAS